MGGLRLSGRTIAIGVLIILVLIVVGSQLLGGQGNDNEGLATTMPFSAPTTEGFADNPPLAGEGNTTGGVALGRVVVTSNIDADGCAVDTTDQFAGTDEVYVVVEDSDIPAGTTVFARLFREGQPLEDADVITADRDYDNTCIYFVFAATDDAGSLEPGVYEAQIIVNGNPGERISFEVQ